MCDTMVVPGFLRKDGVSLFAKNSDREANEGQYLFSAPRMFHLDERWLRCTNTTIPQVDETYAILISRPFWLWGGEMGTNEFGLTIGNEAVFSKIPEEDEPGLLGMDLLRLALERARTAREAIDVITELLDIFGQAGSGAMTSHFYYDNSFLLVDPDEAWVLETAGRNWVAEKVKGIRSISNGHTIGENYDLISEDSISFAVDKGWHKKDKTFNFTAAYADFINTNFSRSKYRRCRTYDFLAAKEPEPGILDIFAVLRDHGSDDPGTNPMRDSFLSFQVCAHAGWGPVRKAGQTTASMVSYLDRENPTHFFTASSAPCLSVFKPVWVDSGIPDFGLKPEGVFDDEAYWWQHELLHRTAIRNLPVALSVINRDKPLLEAQIIEESLRRAQGSREDRAVYSQEVLDEVKKVEVQWIEEIRDMDSPIAMNQFHRAVWRKLNQKAGVSL